MAKDNNNNNDENGREIVRRHGKWLSPIRGRYIGRFTQQLLRAVSKVTPAEIARMQGVSEETVRYRAWPDYQALQDDGVPCYPCYDLSAFGKIVFYKTFRNDAIDKRFMPVYLA